MHTISSIGDKLTSQEVDIFLSNFLSYGVVTKKEAKLLKVATSDNVLNVPQNIKDEYEQIYLKICLSFSRRLT